MLDEHAQVQQVEEDRRGPHEHVRQVGGVDLAEIAGHEAVLFTTWAVSWQVTLPTGGGGRISGVEVEVVERGLPLTLAISSVFLNEPSVRIASPFSSTSVQRNTGSSAAFARRPILEVKMALSSSSVPRLRKSSRTSCSPHSLSVDVWLRGSLSVLFSVEWSLYDAATLFAASSDKPAGDRTRFRYLGRILSRRSAGLDGAATGRLGRDARECG